MDLEGFGSRPGRAYLGRPVAEALQEMTLKSLQDMAKVVGVGAVALDLVAKTERLARLDPRRRWRTGLPRK